MNEWWAGVDRGLRVVAQLVGARAPELTLARERDLGEARGCGLDLEIPGPGGLADSRLGLAILRVVHWARPVEQRRWGAPGVQGGPDGWRILDAPVEANRWQRVLGVCLGRKRRGWADQALEMVEALCSLLPVEQSCRGGPGVPDALDDLDAPDARDALDGRQYWKEPARAVEREPREAARRLHALQREPGCSPGALFGSRPAGRGP